MAAEVGHGRVRGGAAGARRDGERGAAGGGRLGGEDEDERSVLRPRLPAVRQRHHLRQQVPARQVSSDGFVLILSSVFFIQLKTNLSMFNMVRHNVDIEYELSNYYNQNIAYHKGHKSNLHGFS